MGLLHNEVPGDTRDQPASKCIVIITYSYDNNCENSEADLRPLPDRSLVKGEIQRFFCSGTYR